ncbi:hypothetical protein [Solibacillus sp. FSL H8-0538]|uniref:hypothetical protein n=1 Tax=Solibacillus sp. FSL H8-0538 TaxID=2921400 RepID=UPI0030FAC234
MLDLELISLLTSKLAESIQKSITVSERGNVAELESEEQLQEVQHRISENQARVAQELAIAQRIQHAEEVEIEEIYDNSGSAGIGVQASEGTLNFGLHGNGRKVVKRIYRFKGVNEFSLSESEIK